METVKIQDSELKLMEYLWARGALPAKEIAALAAAEIGWNKNTTYTLLTRLVEKGAVGREEPGFVCTALLARERVRAQAARELAGKLFGGSVKTMFAAFLAQEKLSKAELEELRRMVDEYAEGDG